MGTPRIDFEIGESQNRFGVHFNLGTNIYKSARVQNLWIDFVFKNNLCQKSVENITLFLMWRNGHLSCNLL